MISRRVVALNGIIGALNSLIADLERHASNLDWAGSTDEDVAHSSVFSTYADELKQIRLKLQEAANDPE